MGRVKGLRPTLHFSHPHICCNATVLLPGWKLVLCVSSASDVFAVKQVTSHLAPGNGSHSMSCLWVCGSGVPQALMSAGMAWGRGLHHLMAPIPRVAGTCFHIAVS